MKKKMCDKCKKIYQLENFCKDKQIIININKISFKKYKNICLFCASEYY